MYDSDDDMVSPHTLRLIYSTAIKCARQTLKNQADVFDAHYIINKVVRLWMPKLRFPIYNVAQDVICCVATRSDFGGCSKDQATRIKVGLSMLLIFLTFYPEEIATCNWQTLIAVFKLGLTNNEQLYRRLQVTASIYNVQAMCFFDICADAVSILREDVLDA